MTSSNTEDTTNPIRSPWPYLCLVFLTYALTNFNLHRLQPILPTVMATFNIDVAQAGVLISTATFLNIIITFPIGIMITKIGIRRAGLLSMAFLFCGALIGSAVTSYSSTIIALVLGGIGNVFISVSGLAFIGLLFRKKNNVTSTSIFIASATFAQFLTFIILPRITTVGNIKPAWYIDCVMGFICFFLWLIFVRKAKIDRLMAENTDNDLNEDDKEIISSYIRRVLGNSMIWKQAFSIFIFTVAVVGALGYLPTYLVSERGWELKYASSICSLNALVACVSAISSGIISDRLNTKKWIFFGIVILLALLRILQITVPGGSILVAVTILQGVPSGGTSQVISSVTHLIKDPRENSIRAAMLITSQLCGIALGPVIFGYLIRSLGYNTSFIILAPLALISLFGIFSIKNAR